MKFLTTPCPKILFFNHSRWNCVSKLLSGRVTSSANIAPLVGLSLVCQFEYSVALCSSPLREEELLSTRILQYPSPESGHLKKKPKEHKKKKHAEEKTSDAKTEMSKKKKDKKATPNIDVDLLNVNKNINTLDDYSMLLVDTDTKKVAEATNEDGEHSTKNEKHKKTRKETKVKESKHKKSSKKGKHFTEVISMFLP